MCHSTCQRGQSRSVLCVARAQSTAHRKRVGLGFNFRALGICLLNQQTSSISSTNNNIAVRLFVNSCSGLISFDLASQCDCCFSGTDVLCCCIKILELCRPNQCKPRPHFLLPNLSKHVKSIPSLAWCVTPTVNEGNRGLFVCFVCHTQRRGVVVVQFSRASSSPFGQLNQQTLPQLINRLG